MLDEAHIKPANDPHVLSRFISVELQGGGGESETQVHSGP